MEKASVMLKGKIPSSFAILGHGYVQHAGSQYREHCLRYRSDWTLKTHDLPDAKALL